jgi:hypothetical protein
MDNENWPMGDEHSEDEGVNENEEEEELNWELNKEEEDNKEYEDEPEKQGTSAAAMGIVKMKCPPFKKVRNLPEFNKYGKVNIISNIYHNVKNNDTIRFWNL